MTFERKSAAVMKVSVEDNLPLLGLGLLGILDGREQSRLEFVTGPRAND
jgi:hypothetical protein